MKQTILVLGMAMAMVQARAQTPPEAGCTVSSRDHYNCRHDEFAHLLAQAKTVRVSTGRMDLFGKQQMTRLVNDLGKQVVTADQRADLVFELEWIDRSGRIDIGPSDVAVGRLNVYDPLRGEGDRGLVWVETFDSGEQTPWPAITASLIQHFRAHLVEK